ncbi:hypothetical protein LI88_01075 [Streptococcus suis]|nr:hypothetical protein LI88_01075 [Streptococcus suis]
MKSWVENVTIKKYEDRSMEASAEEQVALVVSTEQVSVALKTFSLVSLVEVVRRAILMHLVKGMICNMRSI